MPSENHLAQPLQSDTQVSGDVKGSTFSDHGNNDTSQAPKGGMAGYVRVFRYTDRAGWILNIIAFVAAIAAGTLLPLMDLVFGKLVLCSAAVSRASLTRQICFYIYRVFYW
jgi:ATP-binding cassette subfamily B (MDR/TAP) protein 1